MSTATTVGSMRPSRRATRTRSWSGPGTISRRSAWCCGGRFALERGLGSGGEVRFRTAAGVQSARRAANGRGIDLAFGRIEPAGDPIQVEAVGRSFTGRLVRAGVPHFVTAVERVEWV